MKDFFSLQSPERATDLVVILSAAKDLPYFVKYSKSNRVAKLQKGDQQKGKTATGETAASFEDDTLNVENKEDPSLTLGMTTYLRP